MTATRRGAVNDPQWQRLRATVVTATISEPVQRGQEQAFYIRIATLQVMRTHVTFRHPAEFVGDEDDGGGILVISGAHWFVSLLRRVSRLELDEDLCQEDWGVVLFARRNQRKFWIGLSAWDEGAWVAHLHHGPFAWLQRFSSSGESELRRLLVDVHDVLASEPAITEIAWYEENEMTKPKPTGFTTPVDC